MTVNERFDVIINNLYNGNKRAFSLHIGVAPTVIENVVGTRQGKPSYDVLAKVCAKANISGDWLLTGEGSMLKPEASTVPSDETPPDTLNTSLNTLKGILEGHASDIDMLKNEVATIKKRLENG